MAIVQNTSVVPSHKTGQYQSKVLLAHFKEMRSIARLFQTKNWGLGFYFWIRTSAPLLIVNLLFSAVNTKAPGALLYQLFAITANLVLLQFFGATYASERYNIDIQPSFCWSVLWRANLLFVGYVLLVAIIISTFVSLGIEDILGIFVFPIVIFNETSTLILLVILMIISFVAIQVSILGIVVPRALEISYEKRYQKKPVWEETPDGDENKSFDPDEF